MNSAVALTQRSLSVVAWIFGVLLCGMSVVAAPAPQDDQAGQQDEQVVEFDQQYNQRYASQQPLAGDMIPNVMLFDAAGKPFELASTHGKYTVLVFGCLT